MSRVAAAIVNYNTRRFLARCLDSLLPQTGEIIVVDNGSSDGSLEFLRDRYPQVRVLVNAGNPGYGAGLNCAIAATDADYILMLNSDTVVGEGAVSALGAYLDTHPRAAVAGPRLVNADGSLQPSCRRYPGSAAWMIDNRIIAPPLRRFRVFGRRLFYAWPHDEPRIAPWVTGAALAVRLEAVRAVGGFDESFFMYCEETDLCYRLRAAGWQIHFTPEGKVVHYGSGSTEQVRIQMAEEFVRSNMHFYRTHYSGLRVTGMAMVIRTFLVVRLMRDSLKLRMGSRHAKPAVLSDDVRLWKRLLAQKL